MRVRRAMEQDIEAIAKVYLEYERAAVRLLPDKYKSLRDKKKPVIKHVKLALLKDICRRDSVFFVMEHEEKVVGYIFGEIRDDSHPLFQKPKTGELNDIAVLGDHQGKGVGRKLWDELSDWFRKKGCRFVTLSVNPNNQAKRVYEKWGFSEFYSRMIKEL